MWPLMSVCCLPRFSSFAVFEALLKRRKLQQKQDVSVGESTEDRRCKEKAMDEDKENSMEKVVESDVSCDEFVAYVFAYSSLFEV
jgi:hypothetical protein